MDGFHSRLCRVIDWISWYNSLSSIHMGDNGSLTTGGIIVLALRSERNADSYYAEFFLSKNLSVVLQVSYFKYTKKRFTKAEEYF
jgi:phospho-N-acetylmuramoyl-pentapeptide-transferase